MRDEISLLESFDFLDHSQQVRERSRQLCEESRRLCRESQQQRLSSPWPHPIVPVEPPDSATAPADQPADYHAGDAPVSQQGHPIDTTTDAEMLQLRGKEHVLTEQQILELIALVLDHLQLEQQLHIIKALSARTIATVRARLDTKLVRSA